MIAILPISDKVQKKLKKHGLEEKFAKQKAILSENPKHPGLHFEILEPKDYGVYSFRIDRKYRAIFIFRPDKQAIEIINVTVHYR